MTPENDLAMELAAIARRLSEIAEALGVAPAVQPGGERVQQDRLIDVSAAARIARKGPSTIYRWVDRFEVGQRLPSGGVLVSEQRLRAFLDGKNGENGNAAGILMGKAAP